MNLVVGCDYSTKKVDFSIFIEGKYHTWVEYDYESIANIEAFFQSWTNEEKYFTIEGTYYGNNPHSYKKLIEVNTELKRLALNTGFKIKEVPNDKWVNAILHLKTGKKGASKKTRKEAAIRYVKWRFGVDAGKNDNVADSICIGEYGANRIELEKKLKEVEDER